MRVSNPKEVSNYKHSVFNHVSNNPGPTIFYNNKLYFTKWPLFSFSMAKNISEDYSLEFVLDLSTLKIAALPVYYPKWAQNKGWHTSYLLNGKAMNNKGDFIYTIQGDDSISVHFANGEKKRFYAGLSKTGIEKKPITKKTQKAGEIKDVISTTIYRRMFYDKYRNLYYRIADSPIPFTSEYRSLVPAIFEKPLSIIVMDEDFKKVGEFGLAKDTYLLPRHLYREKGNVCSAA